MGHRESKQIRQREVIVEAAAALFRGGAFESVTVREIAAQADISEATFFNYFGSKESVLGEWAESVIDSAFERAALADAERVLRRTMRDVCRDVAEAVSEDLELARQAFRRGGACDDARRTPPPRGWRAPTGARRLVEAAQARGEVRSDWSPERLAALLRVGLAHAVSAALGDISSGSGPALATELARTADLLLDGYRKRHERVRAAPSGSARTATRIGAGAGSLGSTPT